MGSFLSEFITDVFGLIQLDWFALSFVAFVGLFAICFINFCIWGR